MPEISTPTLLLSEDICRNNIQRMADKARQQGLQFKPHMKTHQSSEVGKWLQSYGVEAITVSSVTMASYFADHGWQDITIAFPCNLLEIDSIDKLAENVQLTLLVNSTQAADQLEHQLANTVSVYIELDTGSERTGLATTNIEQINKLITVFSNSNWLEWKGFYSHPGHSYSARSVDEIQQVHQSVLHQIKVLRSQLGIENNQYEVCIGDTPCCSKGTDFSGIDAISPGNFVFYDLMQNQISSCTPPDIATALICPIVDRYPDRRQIAIHGGAIHFSKESIVTNKLTNFGFVADATAKGWEIMDEQTYLARLSQEHGIVQCSPQTFDQFSVGDTVTILPVHSCLTAHLIGEYQLSSGKRITQMQ